jgi:hypothetical protein
MRDDRGVIFDDRGVGVHDRRVTFAARRMIGSVRCVILVNGGPITGRAGASGTRPTATISPARSGASAGYAASKTGAFRTAISNEQRRHVATTRGRSKRDPFTTQLCRIAGLLYQLPNSQPANAKRWRHRGQLRSFQKSNRNTSIKTKRAKTAATPTNAPMTSGPSRIT